MPEIFRIEVSREEFEKSFFPKVSKYVLVEIADWKEEVKTKSGISIGFNPDVLYAEGASSHIADVARVHGRIVAQPEQLYYHRKKNDSPSWLARLETKVGDYVWFHPLISTNCEEILVGDRLLKVIPYDDLFVARRGGLDGEIIPLNGHCILKILKKDKTSALDFISEKAIDYDRGEIVYVGQPNLKHQDKRHIDHPDLRVGDVVILDSRFPPAFLERNAFNMNFDGDNQYFVMQRHFIGLVVNR